MGQTLWQALQVVLLAGLAVGLVWIVRACKKYAQEKKRTGQ